VATTMEAIAAESSVALKTVYVAFETKSGLLRALWNHVLRAGREAVPVAEQPWYREVVEEPDPERQLRLNARNSCVVKRRIGRLLEVIRSAAATDDEVGGLWNRIETDFHANQQVIVDSLNAKQALRPTLDPDRATDILWTLNHPSQWHQLVIQRGWTPEEYEQWFADAACHQLLNPETQRQRAR
jgi:AcrR family transcriptional regulator